MIFECKYKLELEDCLQSAKYVYKSQKRKQDKVIAILLPILMLAMVAMLVFDLVNKRSIVWDVVLLVALAVLELIYLIIPLTITHSQKKSFKAQKLGEMDYFYVRIDENSCTETVVKDGQQQAMQTHNLRALSSYIEDNVRLVLVFNKVEYVCLKKDKLTGDILKLKALLQKNMSKAQNGKK